MLRGVTGLARNNFCVRSQFFDRVFDPVATFDDRLDVILGDDRNLSLSSEFFVDPLSRIRSACNAIVVFVDDDIGVSIGGALGPQHGSRPDDLLAAADLLVPGPEEHGLVEAFMRLELI